MPRPEAPTHAEGYRRQLETYRAAAVRLLDLDESACSMTVLFVEPGVGVVL